NAGVPKQVQRLSIRLSIRAATHPFPHRGHIGEEAEVAERRALRGKAHIVPRHRPTVFGHRLEELPAATAVFIRTRHEFTVRVPIIQARGPHGLRFWTDEAVGAVAFQLTAKTT